MAIAEQMGVTLANTAYSVNIKERLDFSCALFDAEGNLVANAPHMPVHLGSMGESVKTIIERRGGTMEDGDVFVLNAPYNGGTHLPDVTVIAPVFLDASRQSERESGSRAGVLRGVARPPRRHRRHHAGIDAARLDARRRGRRAARQRAARGAGPLSRGRDARDPLGRPAPVAQRRAEPRRPARAGRRLREGCARACEDGRALRPSGRARLHAARAGQRGGIGAPRARRAEGRPLRVRDGQPREDRRDDFDRQGAAPRDGRLHRARANSSRRTSTRPRPCARQPCCTCSARWSTTRSR